MQIFGKKLNETHAVLQVQLCIFIVGEVLCILVHVLVVQ